MLKVKYIFDGSNVCFTFALSFRESDKRGNAKVGGEASLPVIFSLTQS